jgi:hypothetical protein
MDLVLLVLVLLVLVLLVLVLLVLVLLVLVLLLGLLGWLQLLLLIPGQRGRGCCSWSPCACTPFTLMLLPPQERRCIHGKSSGKTAAVAPSHQLLQRTQLSTMVATPLQPAVQVCAWMLRY